jgi:crossover junction endodeoxyribonuclease RuvC
MIYLGIDPGKSGAVAVLTDTQEVYDLTPSHADNVAVLAAIKAKADAKGEQIYATLEKVTAMPKQGVASSFDFGQTFGVIIGALYSLGIPFSFVTPSKWKSEVFDSSPRGKEKAEQKTAARDLARRLYPGLTDQLKRIKDADRAEAVLLAEYGKRTH